MKITENTTSVNGESVMQPATAGPNVQALAPPAPDVTSEDAQSGGCQQRLVRRVRDVSPFGIHIGNDAPLVGDDSGRVMTIKEMRSELDGWHDDTKVIFYPFELKDQEASY